MGWRKKRERGAEPQVETPAVDLDAVSEALDVLQRLASVPLPEPELPPRAAREPSPLPPAAPIAATSESVPPAQGDRLMTPLDALELDLRRLPNVSFVGFMDRGDALVVQILAVGAPDPDGIRTAAERACFARLDRPFHVEIAGSSKRDRIRILDVRNLNGASPNGMPEIEVHLGYEGVRTIGRAPAGDAQDAARATFEALKKLGARVPFTIEAAALFEHPLGEGVMLVLGSTADGERYGVAAAHSVELAAVRATLHALNRYLSTQSLPANGA